MFPRLMGKDKTVVRGGFRIAYDFAYYNLATNVEASSPFTNLATITDASGNAAGIPNLSDLSGANIAAALFPLAPKGNPGFATELQFGPNFRNPYSEQWNLGIQGQIGSNAAVEVRYVGNHDLANFQEINGNPDVAPLIDNGFASFVPAGLRTPCTTPNEPGSTGSDQLGNPVGYANCNFSRVIEYANTAYSIYNGVQSQFRLQNVHGFTGEVSYTFSKTIDNASEAFSTSAGTVNAISQSPFDISRAERGLSNYDYPNVLGLLWIYDLPFHRDQSSFLDSCWEVGRLMGPTGIPVESHGQSSRMWARVCAIRLILREGLSTPAGLLWVVLQRRLVQLGSVPIQRPRTADW